MKELTERSICKCGELCEWIEHDGWAGWLCPVCEAQHIELTRNPPTTPLIRFYEHDPDDDD